MHLKEAGVEDRKICEISGHKNPASLTAYDRTSAERAVDLSAAIDTKRVAPAPANPPSRAVGRHEFAVRERLSLQCWQRHVQQRDVQLCATAAEEEEGVSRKTAAEKDPRAAPPEQDS